MAAVCIAMTSCDKDNGGDSSKVITGRITMFEEFRFHNPNITLQWMSPDNFQINRNGNVAFSTTTGLVGSVSKIEDITALPSQWLTYASECLCTPGLGYVLVLQGNSTFYYRLFFTETVKDGDQNIIGAKFKIQEHTF